MTKHLVLGNGESRAWFNPSEKKIVTNDVITWGCNAIYRDGAVDNLVAIDYGIQQEIYNSEYQDSHTCWFADWSIIPSEVAEMTLMGFEGPAFIHRSKNKTSNCVVQGKDPAFIQEKIEQAKQLNANIDVEDITKKFAKDVGIWITYVGDNDPVKDIPFPKGWIAGTTALHLACQQGAKEVYMLGFDLSKKDELINNIYKGTGYYLPADTKGVDPQTWINQMLAVFREFKDTQFYWVDPVHNIGSSTDNIDIRYLTKADLCDTLKII